MKFIKSMKTKVLAVFTVLCMLAGSAGVYVSAETVSVSFDVSVSIKEGVEKPESYGVEVSLVDSSGKAVIGNGYSLFVENEKSINWSELNSDYAVKFAVKNAGLGIRLNGVDVSKDGWDAKTISLSNVNDKNYTFELFVLPSTEEGDGTGNQGGGSTGGGSTTNPGTENPPQTYSVDFGNGSWTIDNTTVTASLHGFAVSNDQTITDSDIITLTNFNPDTMIAQVYTLNADGNVDFSIGLRVFVDSEKKIATTHLSDKGSQNYPGNTTLYFKVIQKPAREYSVNFGKGSWTIDNKTVTASINGSAVSNNQSIKDSDIIILTNFNPDTMSAKISASNNFSTTLTVTEGKTSLSARTNNGGYPNSGTLTFTVEGKKNDSHGGGNSGQPSNTDSSATVELKGNISFKINDSNTVGHEVVETKTHTVGYNKKTDENGNKIDAVDITVSWLVNQKLEALTINGVDYSGYLPKTAEDYLKANQDQTYAIVIPGVRLNAENKISGTATVFEPGEMPVGNLKWAYEAGENVQNDELIGNGKMELVQIEYKGTKYSADKLPEWITWDQDDLKGGAVLPLGALVTVKLVPEYGYQLYKTNLNDTTFIADDSQQSVFTFPVKSGNFHLGASFKKTDDKVQSSSSVVTDGSVTLNGEVITEGTVIVNVNDVNTGAQEFEEAIPAEMNDYYVNNVVEIGMDQVWYKGTDTDYWAEPITEMGDNSATVTLSAPKGQTDIQVMHEKHDGTYEVLDGTQYNPETGELTFTTDSFSRFALVYKDELPAEETSSIQINYLPWQFGENTKADVSVKVGTGESSHIEPFNSINVLKNDLVTVTVTLPDEREGKTPIAEIKYKNGNGAEKVDVIKNMKPVEPGVFEFDLPSEISDYEDIEVIISWSDFDYMEFELTDDEYMVHTIIHDNQEWGSVSFETKENRSVFLNNEANYIFTSGSDENDNVMTVTPKPGYLLMDVIIDNVIGYFNYDNQDFEGTKYSLASVLENGSYLIPVEIKMSTTTVEMFFTKCEEHHAADTVTGYKAPTCTEEGYSGDKLCTECGEVAVKGKAIAAKGHSYEKHVCAVCNELETGYTYYEFADGSGKEANKATGFKDTQTTIVSGAGKKYIAVDVVLTYEDEPTKEYKTDVTIKSDTEKLVTDYNKETGILYVTLENYRHIGIKAVLTVNGLSKTLTLRWSPKQPEIVTEVALGTLEVPVQNQVTSVAEIVLNSIIAGNIESQSESPIQLSATIGELSALMSAPTIKINTTVRSEPVTDSKVLLPGGMRENKVIGALDITLPVFVNDTEVGKLTKLDKPIDITVALPELPKVQKGYRRIFEVCREHEGTVEKIPANIDANGDLVITSALYSEYVITYRDELITETPSKPSVDTSDHSQNVLWMALMLASAVAAVGIFCFRKRCN